MAHFAYPGQPTQAPAQTAPAQPARPAQPATPVTDAPAVPQASAGQTPPLHDLLQQLLRQEDREAALGELSRHRENYTDLARSLWYGTGCMAVLLQEVVAGYPLLNPPTLQPSTSNRVCNALALIQCVAAHNDTRQLFLNAQIPLFLYPFLSAPSIERPFEYLRLTSLGVIGALVKADEGSVVQFLLGTEIVPVCLKIMERGSELSKTVATFIVQKILAHDTGLTYVCATPERFMAVATVLRVMVQEKCTGRLLRHIIRCFLRLSEHPRACEALKMCLPQPLRDGSYEPMLKEDPNMRKSLQQLLNNIGDAGQGSPVPAPGAQPALHP